MLRIVADENIPLVAEAFGGLGEVLLASGREIDAARVRNADVLLVRSVTRVDAALVAGSRLRFVGSATIGTDHVDVRALAAAGIPFHYAPGSNADSVVEYVLAALLALSARRAEALRGKRVGIVGCGNIGGRLAARLPALGVEVLRNDPPRATAAERSGVPHEYVPLEAVLEKCDVVTLHVPLTVDGPHPTRHLVAETALGAMRPDAWLVNTSRGAVVDGRALHDALAARRARAAVLDVWEHEPAPDPALIEACALATPHVAGYSWDGKVAGTVMLHDALVQELGLVSAWRPESALPAAPAPLNPPAVPTKADAVAEARWLHALTALLYDIEADDARMRALVHLPAPARAQAFHELRRLYPARRTFAAHALPARAVPAEYHEPVRAGLGITLT